MMELANSPVKITVGLSQLSLPQPLLQAVVQSTHFGMETPAHQQRERVRHRYQQLNVLMELSE
jgi:hypothetical protein